MHFSGPLTIADLLGDFVAYRSLRPCDARIAFEPPARLPRKPDPAYGALVVELLHAARAVEQPGTPITRILVIGDNRGTDGAMFAGIRQQFGDQAQALIVDETGATPELHPARNGLALADGWTMLKTWAAQLTAQQFVIDHQTAIVLDVDKTLLGPKGRNAAVIDLARREAMQTSIKTLVGKQFDQARFAAAYQHFNQPAFHSFTGDNQDIVALLCLVAVSGAFDHLGMADAINTGRWTSVGDLITNATAQPSITPVVQMTFEAIGERVSAGDPTPFKAFRVQEYLETVHRMGTSTDLPPAERLAAELCLNGELVALSREWQAQGGLLIALSDKPDEAALPASTVAAQGYRPLHHTPTHAVHRRS